MTTKLIEEKSKRYLSILLLCSSTFFLLGLQDKLVGWVLLICGILSLWIAAKNFRKNLLLIFLSVAILGITPINTKIDAGHFSFMGATLLAALAIPYLVSRYIYKESIIRYTFHHGRKWYRREVAYIIVTAVIAYFLLPFYLVNTGSYHNWTVVPGTWNIIKLFIGTNGLGIWDELFFVGTVLAILRRYLPFAWANLIQAVLFTSFLYELGFRGWGPPLIYAFALTQGYIFKKTDSLLYIITIHLTLDLVLFLALIDAHHPTWLPIFIT